jgi:hypothetical protein
MADVAVGRLVWAALADLGREAARDGRVEVAAHVQTALAVLPRAWKTKDSSEALAGELARTRVLAEREECAALVGGAEPGAERRVRDALLRAADAIRARK